MSSSLVTPKNYANIGHAPAGLVALKASVVASFFIRLYAKFSTIATFLAFPDGPIRCDTI